MIKAIAIDDEKEALLLIDHYSQNCQNLNLLQCFTNPVEAIRYLQNNEIDLAFLDIEMPQMNGLDVIKSLQSLPNTNWILTTAYSQFGPISYELDVVDYLLKPFSFERFEKAILKVESKQKSTPKEDFILINSNYIQRKIYFYEIEWIESIQDDLYFHLSSEIIKTRQTLKKCLELLPSSQFVRIHRSFIIPVNKIIGKNKSTVILPSIQLPIGSKFIDNLNF